MKKVIAAIALAAFALTGCGNDPTVPSEGFASISPMASSEKDFLYNVNSKATPILAATPDENLIRTGRQICTTLDDGVSINEVLDIGLESGYTMADLRVLVAASLANFCPQHVDSLDSGISA